MYKFSSSPAYSLGNKPKQLRGPEVPGPGAYDQSTSSGGIGRKAPGAFIGHAPRDGFKPTEIPGPGAYEKPVSIFSKVKGGYMGGKKEPRHASDVPGPGSYEPGSGEKKAGYSFPRGDPQRQGLGRDASPGPGAYEASERGTHLNRSAGNVLARAARQYLRASDTPGPGSYEQDLAMLKDRRAPAVSKAPRDTFKPKQVPGPGGYQLRRDFEGPPGRGFSLDKAPRDRSQPDGLPGPGNYEVDSAFHKLADKRGARTLRSPSSHPQVAQRRPERLGSPRPRRLRRALATHRASLEAPRLESWPFSPPSERRPRPRRLPRRGSLQTHQLAGGGRTLRGRQERTQAQHHPRPRRLRPRPPAPISQAPRSQVRPRAQRPQPQVRRPRPRRLRPKPQVPRLPREVLFRKGAQRPASQERDARLLRHPPLHPQRPQI